ncbi:hypothetical protein BKA93DRAFT_726194, partial [Sparassis latifolia]
GEIPLVIDFDSADFMASLIQLKVQVEENVGAPVKYTFTGATEAHPLAKEISDANTGVIITPTRPFPSRWERRRMRVWPPMTGSDTNAISVLAHNATAGLRVTESCMVRNTRFDSSWVALESGGAVSKADAIHWCRSTLRSFLGLRLPVWIAISLRRTVETCWDSVKSWGSSLLAEASSIFYNHNKRTKTLTVTSKQSRDTSKSRKGQTGFDAEHAFRSSGICRSSHEG